MADSYTVRPIRAEDTEAVREICVETSSLPLRNEKDRQFLLLMYCDPYIGLTQDSFVAVDENGRVVGYILCASDTRSFFGTFGKETLPQIKKLGIKYSALALGNCAQQVLCSPLAPAHLHIDLTEAARRKGVGTALMNELKGHLASQGISRVQLTCGSRNKSAIAFYKHNGFKTVLRGFGACVMRGETGK